MTPVKKGLTGAALALAISTVSVWEGYYSHPYRDSVGVKTICYGATAADHVDFSKTYTKAECLQMLGADLQKYDKDLQKCLTPAAYAALPPHRHAALVSFDYNVGAGAFCKSSVARDLNAGNVNAGCNALLRYDRGGGRVIQGLANRRRAERSLCLMKN